MVTTDSYEDALRLALSEKPDLVVMDMFLDNESYPVRVVRDGPDTGLGWRVIKRPPTVECSLPYATGCEFIRAMHSHPDMADTRFILITFKTNGERKAQ